MDEFTADVWRAGPRSKVTYDIEDVGTAWSGLRSSTTASRLVTPVLEGVSNGWPAVLAGLTTLLETGSALPAT